MTVADTQEELLIRAQAGDTQALEALLRKVQPQLYRFSMKMCRHPEDAEDVLQDSMISIARSLSDYRGTASLSTWLFTIARSFCIKKRRKAKHAPAVTPTEDGLERAVSNELSPQEQAEKASVWRSVRSAIATLEPEFREVLILRDIEGLSAKEVSAVVDASVAAVKSRLHRARLALREALVPLSPVAGPDCPDIRSVFSMHLEGDVSVDVCSTMEAHVAVCPRCAVECEGLRSVFDACANAPCEIPAQCDVVSDAIRALFRD
jgi:RNA polymerase sigma-70 factor (ECF subfamily)